MKLFRWFVLLFAAFLFLPTPLHGATLIPTASPWRWRPGTNEASTPIPAWRTPDFADTQFTTAPAPFWYGDVLPDGTRISGMQGQYGALFLRKTFVVTNRTEIGALRMSALVDDGFVAWINGTEVLRVSMPGTPGSAVTTATLANNAAEPVAFATYELASPPSYLRAGTNVLAVQVFQSNVASSDLGFEASLESVLTEIIPPHILLVDPQPTRAVIGLTTLTVTFSEPVSAVVAAHLLVQGIGATSVSPVNDSTYTFTFPQPPYGQVSITWNPAQTITDRAEPPNRFNPTGPGATWSYTLLDQTSPLVGGLSPGAQAKVRSLTGLSVLFTEPVRGVDAADLRINNRPATSVTAVAASQYVFTFPEPEPGTVQLTWVADHNITDLAPTPNVFAGGSWTYRLDPHAAEDLPYISEFMASNTRTLRDETGQYADWIEIYNPSETTLDLDGWYLTDSLNNPTKWRFPSTPVPSGGFLVVLASGQDRRISGVALHTSFQLAASGEYLALVRPDGITIASEWAPAYPQQIPDVSFGVAQVAVGDVLEASAQDVYFTRATPGAANLGGNAIPGPRIEDVRHTPNVPLDHENLTVTARVAASFHPVANVTLRYRILFGAEASTPMRDDGTQGDGAASDGVFGATIPANLSTNGQMIRYAIAATDVNANASRWPLFTQPTGTDEYLGTIVQPTQLSSKLPVFHLFVAPGQMAGIDSESGGRVSFFYDGEFYDNLYMELRGNTSAGLNKKSHRLEFNRGRELRHAGPGGRTRRSSLLAEHLDPAYLRQHLCFWFLNQIGVPAPFHYPVRVEMNGQFYQLAFHNDVIGQEQIERMGYDPRGALYKAVGNLTPDFASTGVFQKLEPEGDPSRTDYLQLANGINERSSLVVRRNTVFDLLDVPQVINHLAGTRWCSENDDVWANMSFYRDTFGDGLWRNIPFDMNASWGQLYGGSNPLEATVDSSKSHPLYGGSGTEGRFNRLYDVIIQLPETRQMLLRRQRSILDQRVQPPETPAKDRILENYIRQMTNLISAEANLDRAKWGFSPWAPGKTFSAGVGDLLNQFIGPRRRHWYVTHSITNTARPIGITSASNAGIPLPQPPQAFLTINGVEFNPASGNQLQEFVALSNSTPFALDISGWKLDGGIQFTFRPGTVVPSNSVLYVSPDVRQFRARTVGPRGGQGLFVVGPSSGQLSARGESLALQNQFGQTVATHSYPGAPSPAQQFLRITEIMFHPAPLAGNPTPPDEFEFVELKNISASTTLDLAAVRMTGGVEFSFTSSAFSQLAPGARVLVVRNLVAFQSRYGTTLPVAGTYTGQLDNGGERLQLLDARNEEILDFSYADDWHVLTDGLGFSLVVVNESVEPDAWSRATQWRLSGLPNGTPGHANEPLLPPIPPILINEALTHGGAFSPADAVELHNPTAAPVDLGGWWLSDDLKTPAKFRFLDGTIVPPNGYRVIKESQFGAGPTGFALGSDGDEVWLFSADREGQLTGYLHGHRFGAADEGVSFGRLVTRDGREHFVAQQSTTLGFENSGPRVGPVVIGEVMYHPLDDTMDDGGGEAEYIELVNLTANPIRLSDDATPSNPWRIRGGVDYDFPTGVTLAGHESVLLVSFSPTNTVTASAFRARYDLGQDIRLFGPYSGRLDNSGQNIELKKPGHGLSTEPPWVLVDDVNYHDVAPWPEGADGLGLSLQRSPLSAFGNDPDHWVGAAPTPARETNQDPKSPFIVIHPVSQSVLSGGPLTLSLAVTNTATLPLTIQLRRNHVTLPPSPSTSFTIQAHTFFLTLTGTDAAPPWSQYSFVVSNPANPTGVFSATAFISYLADADADGLPDTWETSHFGALDVSPVADPDGDGLDNREESIVGTDPRVASSRLNLEAFLTPEGVVLQFHAVSGLTYTAEYADDLGFPVWRKLSDIVAESSGREVRITDLNMVKHRIYRLVTPRQR